MNKIIVPLLLAGATYFAPTTENIGVQAAETQSKASVKVPAMRNRVYTQFARAQKIADEGNKAEGLAVLDEVKERIDSLNSYEQAMLWNFYGFMYYGNDDLANALASFKKVVAQEAIPASLRLSTLYSLAQLSLQQQDYKSALDYLAQWQANNTKALTANQHVMIANAYYLDKNYEKSLVSINNAVELAETKGESIKENWLILQRANYYELKQPEMVAKVLEKMVRLFDKPKYWIQLSGMYGELGQEEKQLAVLEAAWQAGYVEKSQDIITLAQLYRFKGAPYKAAKVLSESIENGVVVANERHLEMVAQSFIAAKNEDLAIPVLVKASEIADTGKFDALLAQTYLNTEKWQKAIASAEKAVERGGIDRLGDMQLILGMSYFNLKDFDSALLALGTAKNIKESSRTAEQWFKYVKREQGEHERLAMLQGSSGE